MRLSIQHSKQALCAVLCIVAGLSFGAVRKKGTPMSLEQMTKASDSIVVGKVKGKSAGFVGTHIETNYEVEVSESLKGNAFHVGAQVPMTVVGGSVTTPPLTQFVEAQPFMYPGEEVALFLSTKPPQVSSEQAKKLDPKSKLLTTPRVVGMNQGKFTIFTGSDGKRKLTRVNLEERGVMPSDAVLSGTVAAIAANKLKTVNAPVLPVQAVAAGANDTRDPLEATSVVDPASGKVNPHAAVGHGEGSGPIPVQDFDEFKTQVLRFSQE
jgi:hypothetical protein